MKKYENTKNKISLTLENFENYFILPTSILLCLLYFFEL